MNGKMEADRISAYRVAVIMPVKITIEVAPLLEIPAIRGPLKGVYTYTLVFAGHLFSENSFGDDSPTESRTHQ